MTSTSMKIISADEALDMLRLAIGPEMGSAKRFADKAGVSESLLYKMRYGDYPLTGKVARLLHIQRLWDEDRYVWIPERRTTEGVFANVRTNGKAEEADAVRNIQNNRNTVPDGMVHRP